MRFFAQYRPLFRVIFIGVFGYLCYLLLIELAPGNEWFPYEDKVQHVLAFGGVTLMGLLGFAAQTRQIVLGMLLYGAVMEVLQKLFTTTRHASVADWLADMVGVLLAWAVFRLLQRRQGHHV